MRFFLKTLILLLSFAHTATAGQTLVTEVRDLLHNREFTRLEERIKREHATGNVEEIRALYATLFDTAHRGRLALSQEWLAVFPESSYAATAVGMGYTHIAFMSRGINVISRTSREALSQFDQNLQQAATAVHQVNAVESDFFPLLELAMQLELTHVKTGDIVEYVERALDIYPNRFALLRGLDSLQLIWGGNPYQILEICAKYAERIEDYSRELCFIEAAFRIGVEGKIRDRALVALEKRDEEFLNYARADAYLKEWSERDGAKDFVINYHVNEFDPFKNLSGYTRMAREIEDTFWNRGYFGDTYTRLRRLALKRLEDSPDSATLHRFALPRYFGGEKPVMHETRAHWEATLIHQEFLVGTWTAGYLLTANEPGQGDYSTLIPYIRNLIYYANHEVMHLHVALSYLMDMTKPNTIPSAPKGVEPQNVDCEVIRVARLMKAICQHRQGNDTCGYNTAVETFVEEVKERVEASGACKKERESDVRTLLFTPVPAQAFLANSSMQN